MNDTVEIMHGVAHLQSYLRYPGPVALFQKPRHGSLDQVWSVSSSILQKFRKLVANDVLECAAYKVGKTAIGGANFSVESHRNEHIVEGINQVAIALLRAFDYRKKLIELLIAGRRSVALLDAADQPMQLRHFLIALPDVSD